MSRPLFRSLAGTATQSVADAERLTALGATGVAVVGNLKFDITVPDDALALGRELRHRIGDLRSVWVAASTREGEEALLIDALAGPAARTLPAGTLTILVPRHPQRFDAVAAMLRARAIPFVRRSANVPVPADTAVAPASRAVACLQWHFITATTALPNALVIALEHLAWFFVFDTHPVSSLAHDVVPASLQSKC